MKSKDATIWMRCERESRLITERISHPHSIRLLRKLVYGWFFINTLILLPAAASFWGPHSLVPPIEPAIVQSHPLYHLLNLPGVAAFFPVFLILQLVLLILGMLCIRPRLISLLIYIVTINLDNRAYVILDGGNNLLHIFLIYLILMDPSSAPNKFPVRSLNYINNAVSNFAFYLTRIQVVMVYLVSGLAKVGGELWQNGTALYYTLNVEEYSHPLASKVISASPLLSVLGTYATVVYQVCFPWLVWNRRIRPWLLAFGSFIHIQISFVMGLFMFGFAIAVSYFSFTTDEVAKKILQAPAAAARWIRAKKWPGRLALKIKGAKVQDVG